MNSAEIKSFEVPDEVRRFPNGRIEIVTIGGATIGRAVFEPGWRSGYRAGLEIQEGTDRAMPETSQPVGLWLAGGRIPSPAPSTYFWTNPRRVY